MEPCRWVFSKMVLRQPEGENGPMVLLVILLSAAMIGFAALMGYMFYLTPGPHDRL
jgi:hypothetical protein